MRWKIREGVHHAVKGDSVRVIPPHSTEVSPYSLRFSSPHSVQVGSPDGYERGHVLGDRSNRISKIQIPESTKITMEGDAHEVSPVNSSSLSFVVPFVHLQLFFVVLRLSPLLPGKRVVGTLSVAIPAPNIPARGGNVLAQRRNLRRRDLLLPSASCHKPNKGPSTSKSPSGLQSREYLKPALSSRVRDWASSDPLTSQGPL